MKVYDKERMAVLTSLGREALKSLVREYTCQFNINPSHAAMDALYEAMLALRNLDQTERDAAAKK